MYAVFTTVRRTCESIHCQSRQGQVRRDLILVWVLRLVQREPA
ncbi:hypothetical protein L798_03530 [Zootermopsis nevadensis]|uniref:Uncharacterized protein n=1 Tax=Zootermopsis nevadensis TaxID=136037 RepID=A0A067RDI8_ZOONE|nr:hypothetical protein L798_03530 [Zootermopsis nevadensis]